MLRFHRRIFGFQQVFNIENCLHCGWLVDKFYIYDFDHILVFDAKQQTDEFISRTIMKFMKTEKWQSILFVVLLFSRKCLWFSGWWLIGWTEWTIRMKAISCFKCFMRPMHGRNCISSSTNDAHAHIVRASFHKNTHGYNWNAKYARQVASFDLFFMSVFRFFFFIFQSFAQERVFFMPSNKMSLIEYTMLNRNKYCLCNYSLLGMNFFFKQR